MDEKKPDLKEKLFKIAGANFNTVIVATFTLQLGNFLAHYIFQKSSIIFTFILFMLVFVSYLLFKEVADEKSKAFGFAVAKISFAILALSVVNHMFISMSETLSVASPEKAVSIFRLSYFVNFGLIAGVIVFLRNDSVKEALNNMHEKNTLDMLKLAGFQSNEKKPGDIQLCIDTETKKPVFLKYKDRFLHMLILGPTGSGKTSQTIIPMINQDMQNFESGITVLEPKGDLAEKVYAMAEHYGRKAVYFNPLLPDCPYFNPLYGEEEDVIENMATTFKMLNPDSPQFFLDMNETLVRNGLKVLKRLYGNKATLIELNRLLTNSNGVGRKMVTQFSRLRAENEAIAKENTDIASYFLNDYFNEKSKTYEHCSGVRTQVSKLISNKYLRRVLNPPNGENDVNFDKVLAEGGVMTISTAQGKLRDLGRFLGYFIILQLQSSVFRRPGNENTRKAHWLYIDEFQVYSNPGFADMLTQGRSYRVASHLATQNRALIGMGSGQEGKDFIELVSTNARNVIIYPGGNAVDAKYYSEQFGEIMKQEIQKGVTSDQFNPIYGFQKIGYNKVNVRKTEKLEARFSPSDLIYRPFGEITYCLIRDNSIDTPGVGKIQYIPRELNDKLDSMIEEYNESIFAKEGGIKEESLEDTHQEETASFVSDAVVADPVVAKTIMADATGKKVSIGDFAPVMHRGNEVIDPTQEFVDDFVISSDGQTDGASKGKAQNEFEFPGEEEDDLI